MFQDFSSLFPSIAKKLKIDRPLRAANICLSARTILQEEYPKLAPHIEVISFDAPYLKIKPSSSTVASEIHYIKPNLVKKLEEKLNTKIIILNQY